jgi:hypothetical protein
MIVPVRKAKCMIGPLDFAVVLAESSGLSVWQRVTQSGYNGEYGAGEI